MRWPAVTSSSSASISAWQFGRNFPPPGWMTAQAVANLARNPTLARIGLFALARTAKVYQPALTAPPSAWILVLLYTEPDLYASGRIAIDAKGIVWSSNNWLPGTQNGSP